VGGVANPHPKKAVDRSRPAMLTAILLTSSLLLVFAMCASLMWLATVRVRETAELGAVPAAEPDA
jgi:heme/copper-type cytochrome/quinol oxidase subunit 3